MPDVTTSSQRGAVMTGKPCAIASNCVMANPSDKVGNTNTSARRYSAAASARKTRPRNVTLDGAEATARALISNGPATKNRIEVRSNIRAASSR